VLEYSRDHLDWQMKRAGFTRCRVEYSQMHHSPTNPLLTRRYSLIFSSCSCFSFRASLGSIPP
jgi:hypothetical protein